MKKLMTMLLGLGLVMGSVAVFAQPTGSTKSSKKSTKTKAPKATKAKSTKAAK
jgi:hypothetical protein